MKKLRRLGGDYWKYWIASATSMASSNILQYVLALYVMDITGSATVFASMLSIILFPRLLLTPFAGVISDRTNRMKEMSFILMGESIVLVAFFFIARLLTIHVAGIFALVTILEIGEVFYGSAENAIIPKLVDKNLLPDAIAVSKADDGVVFVLSPMIAALIYSKLNLSLAFLVVGILDLTGAVIQKSILADCSNKTKGVLNIHGKKYNDRKRRELCYMVMQDVNHQLFSESVIDDVMLGIKGDEITKKEKAHEILKALDIDEYEDVHPMSLSGGQKQRVAIAGALASHKEILIYDEPTSGLDYTHMIEVANCLQQIAKTGKTQFVITHDPELVAECCDYFIFIDNGKVTDQGEWNKGNIEKIKKYFLKSC